MSPAQEIATELLGHFVAGAALSPAPGARTGEVYDPATGRVVRRVAFADVAEVDLAVAAAREAFPAWRDTPAAQRCRLLLRYRELLASHTDDLARTIAEEHGKTVPDARGEVERGLEVLDFACGIPYLLRGDFSHDAARGLDVYTLREPLGVVAGITPFNFPAMVPLWMFPIALACGNTFVLKPSEKDPSAPVLLAKLAMEAGLPPGALNIVHGDAVAVTRLLEHPDVAAVSFVGSTPVARFIYETAARHGKRVQALGGAKNHMVVLPDADLDLAANAAISAAYGSAGERCMAVSVVVAVGDAGDELVPRIASRVDRLRVGPASDPGAEMGPLVTAAHLGRVRGYVERGVAEGAELVRDGRGCAVAGCDQGFFLGPTLFDRVTPEMAIYRDEIFGPVLCIVRADSLDEAIELINRNPWANGAALFTRDGGAARRFEDRVETGMVGINVPIPVPAGHHSFGGWRASLFGDHGIYGPEGVHFYTRPKVVTRRWPESTPAGLPRVDLRFPGSASP
ncbi:MAG TPA: CoA-acylating methylmalonate-semialdehyde dehydrogenase [Thermoanaerobaculia bacterium]|nr:CoA-acylating methylmalonate-semialdehyde dehydrogenase [Thermoanaerobaculia bacterium]